ncbi:acyl-CoA-binding domain-containing protein 5-B-like [Xyrauchen texanus]|uniref:acyl-CoA-binding domain-containing protein 5-B-like n=1 Tax=Xyrauchen texanus TaxID=154827 RepID=UPI002242C4CF|nr:acyl-CoA-binding domain-containing protein 5-B-like [Xyrauchen texanus]XP_051990560.1 acyl-CoA-binding domain-containing protein 5-B-like [Xyrauchen texanus]XP_051990562.1 acyl-CoA-binding domain-containing protein 5-B-like [Xyrauchen texanus]
MDDPKSIQRRFEAAVKVIRSLPEDGSYDISDDMLVLFYSYYKQATAGPCNTLKPNSWDPIGKAKWEAWKALGNMSKDQAMMKYVQEIQLIIETLPVTDTMEELMDALDPFYEIVEDEDEDVPRRPAQLSTGGTRGKEEDNYGDTDEDNKDESESSDENIEDDIEMEENSKDLSTLAAGRGGSTVFNGSEKNSTSSSTNDTHSSLNSEDEEEELVYSREPSTEPPEFCPSNNYPSDDNIITKGKHHIDGLDDEMYSDSKEQTAMQEKGSDVPRVHLAVMSVVGAKMQEQQGRNRKPQCGSQDGKPQGVTPPFPHPPAFGTVQYDQISPCRRRREHSCQGDGKHWVTKGIKDKKALNTQIAMTLSQLQDNMQDVLQRLAALEVLKASQVEIIPLDTWHSKSPRKRLPWWPLDMSPYSVVLAVMWPFAVHWLVQVYLQKRKR